MRKRRSSSLILKENDAAALAAAPPALRTMRRHDDDGGCVGAVEHEGGSVRVLLVEDSERLQRSLGTALRESGYAVDLTGSGADGLWKAESSDYDVIILD